MYNNLWNAILMQITGQLMMPFKAFPPPELEFVSFQK